MAGKKKTVYLAISQEAAKVVEATADAERRAQANVLSLIIEDWASGNQPAIKPVIKSDEVKIEK